MTKSKHIDKGDGYTHHEDSECCSCPCKGSGRSRSKQVIYKDLEGLIPDGHNVDPLSNPDFRYSMGYNDALEDVIIKLKEYFGVQ